MQGYFQISSFHVPPMSGEPDELALVDYVVISRRSKDRAGLRYQRRGVAEEGNVANFVETESIVRVQVGRSSPLSSAWPTDFHFAEGRSDERFQLRTASRFKYVAMLGYISSLNINLSIPQFHFTGTSQDMGSNPHHNSRRNGLVRNTPRPYVDTSTRLYHNMVLR